MKSLIPLMLFVAVAILVPAHADAGGWYYSSSRLTQGPYATYYQGRTVVNPPGPGIYISRSRSFGPTSFYATPVTTYYGGGMYSTGPVYPAAAGYQFTPYYYPTFYAPTTYYPAYTAPVAIPTMNVYEFAP